MDKGFFWEVMKAVHIRTNEYMARNLGINYLNLWLCKTPTKDVVQ